MEIAVSPRRPGATAGRKRQRNARGQGARLTEEIVAGALALIEESGSVEGVTLRAVARRVGIAAPSIYAHFEDRDAIIIAVVLQVFDELATQIRDSRDAAGADPADRLVAGCAAYLDFGLAHPARYGVLFSGRNPGAEEHCTPVEVGPDGMPILEYGADSFALLADGITECVAAGVSASTDLTGDAIAVWIALHGAVSLRTALSSFPWPDPDEFIRHHVLTLAGVTPR
jgi:AcrR family transcriptional regulator